MNTLTITKQDLRDAMAHWEQQARTGKMRSPVEAQVLPLRQVADESTDFLWTLLESGQPLSQPVKVLVSQDELQRALHLFLVRIKQLAPSETGVTTDGAGADVLAKGLVGFLWLMLISVSGERFVLTRAESADSNLTTTTLKD